ncbi:MAG TPA: class I adenylate-forming enzyme family protein [Actinocrinis sp.]|uniref:class I adenylate-forming enzyme family protein n=1 Tax=Actinocrinis sp. TaxID=1920516 RepID=UPI002DDCCFBD|nr:class I adenylate-forming enzyme family protein [Actinocrinis sp.]HEV2344198.1 class I adenylate-forming enzyme family protein [Actinocrinis sp.]
MVHPADLGALPQAAAQKHGQIPFFSDPPWSGLEFPVRTIGDFARAVEDYADRLWGAGIRRGATVAVVKANHIDIQAIACAAVRIGAVPVLLSVMMEPTELLTCLGRLQLPTLLVDEVGIAKLASHANALPALTDRTFALNQPGAPWAPVLDAQAPHKAIACSADGPLIVTHTSGTTSTPKLVAQSADSLYGHAKPQVMIARGFDVNGLSAKCLSFVHARVSSGLIAYLTVGVAFLAMASPELDDIERQLVQHRPQSLETHPNLFLRWEPLAERPSRPFRSIERYVSTFDAVHPRTLRALLTGSDQSDPVWFLAYGQTEVGPVTLRVVRRADLDRLDGSASREVGKPFAGITDVRVVDAKGRRLPVGTVGFVEARTPGRGISIIGQPPLPGPDEWWRMGDVGRITEEGSLELLDRVADRVDGVPSLLRIEDQLLNLLPQLVEVVLTPYPHPRDGLLATVCTADELPLDRELWAKAAEMAGLPAGTPVVQRRWDELPMTGSWKVRRHRIGPLIEQRRSATSAANRRPRRG